MLFGWPSNTPVDPSRDGVEWIPHLQYGDTLQSSITFSLAHFSVDTRIPDSAHGWLCAGEATDGICCGTCYMMAKNDASAVDHAVDMDTRRSRHPLFADSYIQQCQCEHEGSGGCRRIYCRDPVVRGSWGGFSRLDD
jgi:hypothetical protein